MTIILRADGGRWPRHWPYTGLGLHYGIKPGVRVRVFITYQGGLGRCQIWGSGLRFPVLLEASLGTLRGFGLRVVGTVYSFMHMFLAPSGHAHPLVS